MNIYGLMGSCWVNYFMNIMGFIKFIQVQYIHGLAHRSLSVLSLIKNYMNSFMIVLTSIIQSCFDVKYMCLIKWIFHFSISRDKAWKQNNFKQGIVFHLNIKSANAVSGFLLPYCICAVWHTRVVETAL